MQFLKITFSVLVISLICSCSNDPSNTTSQSGMLTIPVSEDSFVQPTLVDHSILAPMVAHWEIQAVLKVKDSEVRETLDGAWFNLNLDQTFTFGEMETQTGQGTYNYDDATNIIEFFFNPTIEDVPTQFKIHGIGKK